MRCFLALTALCASLLGSGPLFAAPEAPAPAPPSVRSETGYLWTSSSLDMPPAKERIFLSPQQELLLLEEGPDFYSFVAPDRDGSSFCRMAKIPRHTMMLRFSDDGRKAVLRGAVELECLPFKLPAGLELPVVSSDAKSWLALCSVKSFEFRLRLPRQAPGLTLSKESKFDLFAKGQQAKGLAFYEGAWMPADQAEALKASAAASKGESARLQELLRKSAIAGHIVMKDGSILDGKFKGSGGDKLLFEVPGEPELRSIGIDEIARLSVEQALSVGALKSARVRFEAARLALLKKEYGEASKGFEELAASLGSVAKGTAWKGDSLAKLSDDLASAQTALALALDSAGLALYKYRTFPKKELEEQLSLGNILVRSTLWIKPSQLCLRCDGSASIDCPLCKGRKTVSNPCIHCAGSGRLECQVCHGSGRKPCLSCGGKGGFSRACGSCGGTGLVWKASGVIGFEPGSVNAPRIVVAPSGSFVISYRPPIYGPWGGDPYRYIQVACQRCGGTGTEKTLCSNCGGLGYFDCPPTLPCPYCSGKGSVSSPCPVCGGKGKIACPDCKGRGFMGEPQAGREGELKREDAPAGGGVIQSQPRISPL